MGLRAIYTGIYEVFGQVVVNCLSDVQCHGRQCS